MIRLGSLLVVLATHTWLATWATGDTRSHSVRDTLRLGCLTVLGAGLYSGLYALLRRRSGTAIKMPPLTIGNIWAYVYGVGCLGFTTLYCLSASNPLCLCCFLAGLTQVCIDDLLLRVDDELAVRAMRGLTTALGVSGTFIAVLGDSASLNAISLIDHGDLFVLAFGVVIPVVVPHFVQCIRGARREDRVMSEYIAAAMPLAVAMACICLITLAPTLSPSTVYEEGIITQSLTGTGIALLLMPISGTMVLFFLMNTAVLYSVTSFVAPAALVAVTRYFIFDQSNQLTVTAMILVGIGFVLEVYATKLPTHGWRQSLSSYDIGSHSSQQQQHTLQEEEEYEEEDEHAVFVVPSSSSSAAEIL